MSLRHYSAVTVSLDVARADARAATDAAVLGAFPDAERVSGNFHGVAKYHLPPPGRAAGGVNGGVGDGAAGAGGGVGEGVGAEGAGRGRGQGGVAVIIARGESSSSGELRTSEVFERMEALSAAGKIDPDWGINQVGLDEVFRILTADCDAE